MALAQSGYNHVLVLILHVRVASPLGRSKPYAPDLLTAGGDGEGDLGLDAC